MAIDVEPRPLSDPRPDAPVFDGTAAGTADRAVMGGASVDHTFGDRVAALTETPAEAAIDAANGLRGHGGRRPTPEDFEGLLTPAGNSGDITGSDVTEGSTFVLGEDGATKGTIQDR